MATVETLQNLRLITRLYFRVLRWRIQNEYLKEYAEFYMDLKELRALGIRTVKELKLFDEGSWTEYISRVKWDREQFGKKGILYREDLLRKRKAGDLEHIPAKAEVNRIYFKNPGPIPEISIVEQLQELRIDVESNVSGDILATCKWPGLPLFEQCKNSNDVFQLINSKRQNPKDVLKKMIYVQENYLSCFRMLKRMVKHKTQQIPKTTSGKAGETGGKVEGNIEAMRDQVFICYSHKDKRWLEDLETHLKPYVRNGSITAWSDKQIAPGSKWLKEIEAALASTKVAVLLVTPNFLASDFIHENELGPLLKKAEKGKVTIIWIPVRACSYKQTPLKDYQAAVDPEKPLANMKAERDKSWVKICEEIKKATCA